MSESVVLIPGLQSDGTSWLSLYRRLARRHPVTIPMGHQQAPSIEEMGRKIIEQCPQRFHLVGWSMGGYIAFELLRRYPERLLSLTLIATTAEPESETSRLRREEALTLARQESVRVYQTRNLENCLFNPASVDPGVLEAILQSSEALGIFALEQQTAAIIDRPDSRPDLALCPCPVLIVAGQNDAVIPAVKSRDMHALLPGSTYVEIERCGHCPPLEQPDELFGVLGDWLSRTENRTAKPGAAALEGNAP